MQNRRRTKYNDHMLKSGYEAMGQINLSLTEAACASETADFLSYEQSLTQHLTEMERGGIDD